MKRSAHNREAREMDAAADFGPSVTRSRDGRLNSHGPGAVDLEDRYDPDPDVKRLVRGARRRHALGSLYSERVITKRQHDAANRFLDDLSRATGGSSASFTAIVVSGGTRDGLSEGQRKALRSVMRVRLMLGLNPDTIVWWVVLDNRPPADFEAVHRLRHGTAVGWLRNALTALDEHYNGRTRQADLHP